MKYTQYSNTFSKGGGIGECTLDDMKELCKTLIRHNGRSRKQQMPLIKWGVFKDNCRLKKDLLELYCIEIEHDTGTMQIGEAGAILHENGYPFVGYETWSCTEEEPRWRFVLPLEEPLITSEIGSVEELGALHTEFVCGISKVLGEGILSPESWRVAQCWYMGHQDDIDVLMLSNL